MELEKVNRANWLVGIIRRAFSALDEPMFKALFVCIVLPHLKYANQIWCPYKKMDIETIEAVQRRTIRKLPYPRGMTYPERLRILSLPTLPHRRSRSDMIEVYKIIYGVYDRAVSEGLFEEQAGAVATGHTKRIPKQHTRLHMKKYSFCNRVVNFWNHLPGNVVNSKSVLVFERILDKLWRHQEQKY